MATDDTITRYELNHYGEHAWMGEDANGEWVRYDDHKRAIERLQEELAHARGLADSWCDEYNRVERERDEARAFVGRLLDKGAWYYSAIELDHDMDGEVLEAEAERIVGTRP